MKFGIITLFQNYNYGATLQSYALQSTVKKTGVDVETIQYERKAINTNENSKANKSLLTKIKNFVKRILFRREKHNKNSTVDDSARKKLFDNFIAENMKISDKQYTKETITEANNFYDAFICGSDNIWNKNLFDSSFMLDFANDDKRKIAYAPGMSTDFLTEYQKELFIPPIKRLDYISCRERIGSNLLEGILSKKVPVVLDPTLLLEKSEWSSISKAPIADLPSEYMFAYICDHNALTDEKINELCSKVNLPVVLVPNMSGKFMLYGESEKIEIGNVGPAEFIYLIENSKMVLTDSFHGTVFACIFEKEFYCYRRFKDQERIQLNYRIDNLLEILGISKKRIMSSPEDSYDFTHIDWESVRSKLLDKRKESLCYLNFALQGETK